MQIYPAEQQWKQVEKVFVDLEYFVTADVNI